VFAQLKTYARTTFGCQRGRQDGGYDKMLPRTATWPLRSRAGRHDRLNMVPGDRTQA
jgi:hypothetical protein